MILDAKLNDLIRNKSGIYQIRNILNNKRYIGSSNNLLKRRTAHATKLKMNYHPNDILQNAYNKYGDENFVFEVVEFCNVVDLVDRENFYINLYKVCDKDFGYNICPDAEHHLTSDITKEKLRQNALGNKNWLGKKHTRETKQKQSAWHKGKVVKESTKEKLRQINLGKKIPEKTIKKMSESKKGMFAVEKNPMWGKTGELNSFFGKNHTDETKEKIKQKKMGITKKENPNLTNKPKVCLCIETNQIYNSIAEASRKTGIACKSISLCLSGKKLVSTGGFHWTQT